MLHLPLLLAFGSSVVMQPLDGDRFRLTITYRGYEIEPQIKAQKKLAATASGLCKGKGIAVSSGTLDLTEVPLTDLATRRRGDHTLSEEWRCVGLGATERQPPPTGG
jgi:hypothetical protein